MPFPPQVLCQQITFLLVLLVREWLQGCLIISLLFMRLDEWLWTGKGRSILQLDRWSLRVETLFITCLDAIFLLSGEGSERGNSRKKYWYHFRYFCGAGVPPGTVRGQLRVDTPGVGRQSLVDDQPWHDLHLHSGRASGEALLDKSETLFQKA